MNRRFTLEFEGGIEYSTDGPSVYIGPGLGHGNPTGYHFADDLVVIGFGNSVFHKIPERRLLRIAEWDA